MPGGTVKQKGMQPAHWGEGVGNGQTVLEEKIDGGRGLKVTLKRGQKKKGGRQKTGQKGGEHTQ